jgi:hypothetical protein
MEQTLNYFKHHLSSQKSKQASVVSTRLSKVEPKNITTYGRFNTLSKEKYTKFDVTHLTKLSSPHRMQAVTAGDALVDPY